VAEVLYEVEQIEQLLSFLPDSPTVYGEWKSLVIENNVRGVRVYDAHLVASMKAHNVSRILTFNSDDFSGFSGIEKLHPKSLST
jgi:predicted nucleic acid-binding protein